MQIDSRDKAMAFLPFLEAQTKESKEKCSEAAERELGEYWALTLGQFIACSKADFSHIGVVAGKAEEMSVLQWCWIQCFATFCEEFAKICKRLTPPATAEQRMAAGRMMKTTMEEGLLVETRKYFGLRSFAEAEGVSLGEYIIMRKDMYNSAVYQKALNDIYTRKTKIKK